MKDIMLLNFFSLDIRVRAAILFAIFMAIAWLFAGKMIIRIASLFPYLIRWIFRGVYLLIEIPVCWLHERFGSLFHNIDNRLANRGGRIDDFFERWYTCWHYPKNHHIRFAVAIYCIFIIWICIPYHPEDSSVKVISGQKLYLIIENKITYGLRMGTSDVEAAEEVSTHDESTQVAEEINIAMEVITKKSPLSIRDIPSVENCEILVGAEKGNTVFWKGEIAFGKGDDGGIEPWIKVETSDGIIGWARLKYLCPLNEGDFELELQIK